ncbi:MAG: DUF4845 domain-containing protein [Pseudomonadota bacterium]
MNRARSRFPAAAARQRGLSLFSLLVLGVVLVFGALLTMKVFPTALEYVAIKRAVVKARNEGSDPAAIRSVFERAAAIEDITSISSKDLQIKRRGDTDYEVSFAYEKRIPLIGPAWLLLDYRGEATPPRGAAK